MAFFQKDQRSGRSQVRFRFRSTEFKRSVGTKSEREAVATLHRVKDTLLLLESARLALPNGIDPADFILSDGKLTLADTVDSVRLNKLFESYNESLPAGAKEQNTVSNSSFVRPWS